MKLSIAGIRRSGNHAIATWLIYHFDSIKYYNNYMKRPERRPSKMAEKVSDELRCAFDRVASDKDPFEGRGRRTQQQKLPDEHPLSGGGIWRTSFVRVNDKMLELANTGDQNDNADFEAGNELYAIENHKIKGVHDLTDELELDQRALILRDPINNLSSLVHHPAPLVPMGMWRQLFKEYARAVLYSNDFVPIVYDRWFSDPSYRREVEDRLGIGESDEALNRMHFTGGGSSFDKMEKTQSAQEMKVLERWRKSLDNVQYLDLIDDDELLYLRQRIFGDLPEDLERVLDGHTQLSDDEVREQYGMGPTNMAHGKSLVERRRLLTRTGTVSVA